MHGENNLLLHNYGGKLNMIKVGVIGRGFVGNALYKLLETNEGKDFELLSYTRGDDDVKKENIKDVDIAFVCVGTPMKEDKTCDLSQIEDVLSWLRAEIVVIKSTVPPNTCKNLKERYGIRVVHNPEFLTEKYAFEDMRDAVRTVLGGDKQDVQKVCKLYQTIYSSDMKYFFTDTTTSELIKYTINNFLSVKVAFFNQTYDICNYFGINYDELKEGVLLDPRITRSHTNITEQRGFGGHCFPKDLNATINSVDGKVDVQMLKEIWNYNCKIREEFKDKKYE